MPLNDQQKENFLLFLKKVDDSLCAELSQEIVLEFFSLMIDFKLRDSEFEESVALAFRHQPKKAKEPAILEAIKGMGEIRRAMLEDNINSEECREITTNYFVNRIGVLRKLKKDGEREVSSSKLQAEHDELMDEYKSEREKLEDRISQLQAEQQNIHEVEIEEQKRRREEKKAEQEQVRAHRQVEFEKEVEERKERREFVEKQIEALREQLQEEHERQTIERKESKMKREADMRERQQRQVAQQDRQAMDRSRKKEKDKMQMQMRQQSMLDQQIQQKKERMLKKREEDNQRKKIQRQLRKKLRDASEAEADSDEME